VIISDTDIALKRVDLTTAVDSACKRGISYCDFLDTGIVESKVWRVLECLGYKTGFCRRWIVVKLWWWSWCKSFFYVSDFPLLLPNKHGRACWFKVTSADKCWSCAYSLCPTKASPNQWCGPKGDMRIGESTKQR